MHRLVRTAALLASGLGAFLGLGLLPAGVAAIEQPGDDERVIKYLRPPVQRARSGFATAQEETVWVGYSPASADPNKVGVGGKWDFDTNIAGTDSTQFWNLYLAPMFRDQENGYPLPQQRPFWYFDHGNSINRGNTNLEASRKAAGRSFRYKGVVGVWHRDTMAGIDSAGASTPIAGAASAWCGLRACGDYAFRDELTGNAYNGDYAAIFRAGPDVLSAWPGYADQWDQILYHDVNTTGSAIPLSFRLRANLSTVLNGSIDTGGAGWFNPDPTQPTNFRIDPADSVMVWVGVPKETGVYDTNRRWLSDVLDFSLPGTLQPVKLYATTGKVPLSGSDTTVSVSIPNFVAQSRVRVAFQVKTNRVDSDERTAAGGFNSIDGAALIDDVNIGGQVSNFEGTSAIQVRALINGNGSLTVRDPSTTWITTGRPPALYAHIHNVFDLPYNDPCGALGSGDRICNLIDNILVMSDHDDANHAFHRESFNWSLSPTIKIYPGNPQGIPDVSTSKLVMEFDYYTGNDDNTTSAVFFFFGARYMGHGLTGLLQPAAPRIPAWSPVNAQGAILSLGIPACGTFNSDPYLDGVVPSLASIDSLQIGVENQTRCQRFAATSCGKTDGSYWDNVRLAFVGGAGGGAAVSTFNWFLLQDTFPFNEIVAPGSAAFDTTTALIKDALNNGNANGGEGVIPGDTLVFTSPYSGNDTRMDLVFRVLPGPGNYSQKGNRLSPLLKIPSSPGLGTAASGDASFWGQYIASNGQVGSVNRHGSGSFPSNTTYWDPNTWNSARMDSAQVNIYPVISRSDRLGQPVIGLWMGTYHESDPKLATLGITRNICFLVNPDAAADNTNLCCSTAQCSGIPFLTTYPPAGYPGTTPTSTTEGTKIIPDGLLTPGSHVEYFIRRSNASDPLTGVLLGPDTTKVAAQNSVGDFDQSRWQSLDVFPDLWKDTRFGGSGLACLLAVDAADRRGIEPGFVGALDTLGYGKNNGASRGWKMVNPGNPNPDDPAGFVAANLGQAGLAFDQYDIKAAESKEGGRPGCRLATPVSPTVSDRQCKQGPTELMLNTQYSGVIWFSGDLDGSAGAVHDGVSAQEQSDDARLLRDFLAAGTSGDEKALWLNGDGVAQDLDGSAGSAKPLLNVDAGTLFLFDSYYGQSNNKAGTMIFKPLDAVAGPPDPFHSSRSYGLNNFCLNISDVLSVNSGVLGAAASGRYEDQSDGNPNLTVGTYIASVYRPLDATAGRFYTTLVDGFDFNLMRGNGARGSATDAARIAWMSDALAAFNVCSRVGPVVAVGDEPGVSLNFVRGAFPNPSISGAATVQFTLAQAAKVTIRFYNVAGRLVHEQTVNGVSGINNYKWNGVSSTGQRAATGVYFYRLSAPGIQFQNNGQRMVLLGQRGD